MNLDNGGNSVVFDAKTQEAINLAKNRIDELNNDIARLTKAKQVEQADVKELQDEKVYLDSQLDLLRPEVDILKTQVQLSKEESLALNGYMESQKALLNEEKAALATDKEQAEHLKVKLALENASLDEAKQRLLADTKLVQEEKDKFKHLKDELNALLNDI